MIVKPFIFIVFLCFMSSIMAQEDYEKKDSTQVYKKIESFSKQRKFTKDIHKLIFKSTITKKVKRRKKRVIQNYKPFQGKIIRNIHIETLDPFGFSVDLPNKKPKNWIGRVGNNVHLKSKTLAIRNLLLFRENTSLDTFRINESKRLMRSQNFIRSVLINVKNTSALSDSVDVEVRVLDSWSLIPKGSISTSRLNVSLDERNFLGLGHQFNNRYTKRFDDNLSAHSLEYVIPTIKNTYINTRILYDENLNGNLKRSLNIERGFISPLTRWAGGLYFDEQFSTDSLPDIFDEFSIQKFKFQTQDFWFGRAFKIFDGDSQEGQTTNLITSFRFSHSEYKDKPNFQFDTINFFSREHFYQGSIGITSRQFVEDEYIFRDGIIEDVPVGFAVSISPGYQRKNKENRYYLGAKLAFAEYLKWGYINASVGYGTFINNSKKEQTALTLEFNYFTNLISLDNNWKMRQFVKPQVLLGFNRLNSIADRVTLNEGVVSYGYNRNEFRQNIRSGISGFNSNINGTQKAIVSLQTQFYSPWNILGFRLNPFVNITSGLLANEKESLFRSKVYSSFGVGFIIRNDYLVFSSFQLSLSYYPEIPGQGTSVFKTNAFETEDFGFQSIEIGKPSTILYQ